MNLNKVYLIGRLTKDPEARSTPSGQNVTTISMATNRVWSDASGKKEATEYHTVIAWGRLGEIANNYLKKGGLVLIEGRMQTRQWTDKTGNKRYTTEVVAESLQLGPRSAGTGSSDYARPMSSGPAVPKAPSAPVKEDDIPIIGEDEPMNAGVEEGEIDIKESDLPF
jgi:single-strand DNA-binding protein